MEIKTWADGFGRWCASVPAGTADPQRAAASAIRRQLALRDEVGPGYRVRVEPAPDASGATLPGVFREKI